MKNSEITSSNATASPGTGVFSVEEATDHFWICDGARRVLLLIRMPQGGFYCNAVFLRQPDSAEPSFPESYHSATAIGLQADIRWRWGSGWLPMDRVALNLTAKNAEIGFERRSKEGRNLQQITLTLSRTGNGPADYRVNVRSKLLADTPAEQSIEFLNYLPADAGNSWPDKKRFDATIHETPTGEFERRPHSQLSVIEPYYWPDAQGFRRPEVKEPAYAEVFDPALRRLGAASPYAVSHLHKPFPVGGMMFFSGEKITPAVRVLAANTPVVLHTCDVWYDEHLCLERGVPQLDGRFLYEVTYELFCLPATEAEKIASEAVEVTLSEWVTANDFAPFFTDRVNFFNAPIARERDGSSGLFFAYENPRHLVSWQRATDLADRGAIVLNTLDPIEPPSGQYYQSVRYSLSANPPWAETFPLGFSLHLDRGKAVEFSALIRVEGEVEAWLELREAFWGKLQRENGADFDRQVEKTDLVNADKWTRVSGRLTAKIPGSLSMIFLAMSGRGRASFAELSVRRVD
ncbi:hypothetical protein [Oleiharenicola lentus]|uniref:hypothetical protein n=1 Tax=Oleiharenicola lentus TaxID=2508720 RepID=UPI003F67CDE2